MLKLALTARWIAALVLCLLLAVAFALLAQWQINRTFIENTSNEAWSDVKIVDLETVAEPNAPFTFNEISVVEEKTILTKVMTKITFNPSRALLVANRIQLNGDSGYWVVVPTRTEKAELFVAVGFVQGEEKAKQALAQIKELFTVQAFMPVMGRLLPSEAPEQSLGPDVYATLSVPQLINNQLDEGSEVPTYTGFLALTEQSMFNSIEGVQPLTIGMPQSDSQVNWLSAFYAIEWTVFAGFAVFMWWRLLADAYKKQQLALVNPKN
jgi:cytochrome oxidase assembly protein ShyY1